MQSALADQAYLARVAHKSIFSSLNTYSQERSYYLFVSL